MINSKITLDFGRHWPGFHGLLVGPSPVSVLPSFAIFFPSSSPKLELPPLLISSTVELGWGLAPIAMAEAIPAGPDDLPSLIEMISPTNVVGLGVLEKPLKLST